MSAPGEAQKKGTGKNPLPVPFFCLNLILLLNFCDFAHAGEVIKKTSTTIVVREHPKTGRPYVSIASTQNSLPLLRTPKGVRPPGLTPLRRPDYRMLDPKVKTADVSYDGPSSDRKKVYLFAASLATVGTVGGIVASVAIPASATTSSAGGTGVYAAAGSAVTAGTLSASLAASKSKTNEENYTRESRSQLKHTKVGHV